MDNKQNRFMTVMLVLLIIELFFLALVVPLRVTAEFRFSLDNKKCFLLIKVLGLPIFKIKIEKQKQSIRISINGKLTNSHGHKTKEDSGNSNRFKFPRALAFIKAEHIIKDITCLGIIGGETAEDAAYNFGIFAAGVCTLLPEANTSFVYPDFKSERCDFEMKVFAKVSFWQAVKAAI